jgi:hypothetical protein
LDENAVKRLFFRQFGQARNLLQCFPDNLKFVMAVKVVAFGVGVTAKFFFCAALLAGLRLQAPKSENV